MLNINTFDTLFYLLDKPNPLLSHIAGNVPDTELSLSPKALAQKGIDQGAESNQLLQKAQTANNLFKMSLGLATVSPLFYTPYLIDRDYGLGAVLSTFLGTMVLMSIVSDFAVNYVEKAVQARSLASAYIELATARKMTNLTESV